MGSSTPADSEVTTFGDPEVLRVANTAINPFCVIDLSGVDRSIMNE